MSPGTLCHRASPCSAPVPRSYQLGSGEAVIVSEDPVNDGEWHRVTATRWGPGPWGGGEGWGGRVLMAPHRQGRRGWLQVDGEEPVHGKSPGANVMANTQGSIYIGTGTRDGGTRDGGTRGWGTAGQRMGGYRDREWDIGWGVGWEVEQDTGLDVGQGTGWDMGWDTGWHVGWEMGWDVGWGMGWEMGWNTGWDRTWDSRGWGMVGHRTGHKMEHRLDAGWDR